VAHVGYLPGERIIGLSKLGCVVELFARDLQIQERMTTQIARWLQRELEPKGVGVVLEAEHMCMSLRGVEKLGASTITTQFIGSFRDDAAEQVRFMTLVHKG
jgi:GTP cyclohydrolase I